MIFESDPFAPSPFASATALLEALDAGGLQQGWTEVTLPDGVMGYGVFRQTVQGRSPQEAVVPLSPDNKQVAELIWDDAGFDTAVALVNPGDVPTYVNIAVSGANGSSIGSRVVYLPAHGRSAFVLHSEPGLAGMTSGRGKARFSVSTGAIAALGLRFGISAFTSIPVTYP